MMPGFLHRLNAELINLVNISTYVNKLAIKEFHFHSPPSQLNYAAWLGGSFSFV
jgi:actin-related protein